MNIGKWVLRNLFIGFVREEQRRHLQDGAPLPSPSLNPVHDHDVHDSNRSPSSLEPLAVGGGTVVSAPNMIPAVMPVVSPQTRSSPLLTPLIPLHPNQWRDAVSTLPSIPQSPMPIQDVTSTPVSIVPQRARSGTVDSASALASSPNIAKDDYFSTRTRHPSIQGGSNPIASDDFSGWSGPGKQEPQTPSTPSGIMGRLKNFGKIAKRPPSEVQSISTPESATVVGTPVPPSVSLILNIDERFLLNRLLLCLSEHRQMKLCEKCQRRQYNKSCQLL